MSIFGVIRDRTGAATAALALACALAPRAQASLHELGLDDAFSQAGLETSASYREDGYEEVVVTDRLAGALTISTFSPLGELLSIEFRTRGGAVTGRRLFYRDRHVEESYHSDRKTIRTVYAPYRGWTRIQTTVLARGKAPETSEDFVREPDASRCAPMPTDFNKLNHFLGDLSRIELSTQSQNGDIMDLSNNVRLHGCNSPRPGESAAARDQRVNGFLGELRKAMRTLVSCLGTPPASAPGGTQGGQPTAARRDAAALAAILGSSSGASRLTIRCNYTSGYGAGQGCGTEDFPGIHLGTVNAAGTHITSGGGSEPVHTVVLHEMMHAMGYKHFEGIDIPWMVQHCCLKSEASAALAPLAAKSCEMLTNPSKAGYFSRSDFDRKGPFWASDEYLDHYQALMNQTGFRLYSGQAAARVAIGAPGQLSSDRMGNTIVPMMLESIRNAGAESREYALPMLIGLRAACTPADCGPDSAENHALYTQKLNAMFPSGSAGRAVVEKFGDALSAAHQYHYEANRPSPNASRLTELRERFATAWSAFRNGPAAPGGACSKLSSGESAEFAILLRTQSVFAGLGVPASQSQALCPAH